MKKLFLGLLISFMILSPFLNIAHAAGLVPCGTLTTSRCEFQDVFKLIENVFNFIVMDLATPLTALLIVIGGLMLVLSAGSPGLVSQGRQMIIWSIVAWVLIFTSWLIIKTVLIAIGYSWGSPFTTP